MDDLEQAAAHVRGRPFVWFIRVALSGLLLLILATLVGGMRRSRGSCGGCSPTTWSSCCGSR
jgi:hypothetical protein